jgi:hypothetical protein
MDERYETWESLANEIEINTAGTADCWTCLLIDTA